MERVRVEHGKATDSDEGYDFAYIKSSANYSAANKGSTELM